MIVPNTLTSIRLVTTDGRYLPIIAWDIPVWDSGSIDRPIPITTLGAHTNKNYRLDGGPFIFNPPEKRKSA